tara:strand:+ start:1286 stop:1687 length:402 start_codon:yes stop_codon:yes gene_type:complete
MTPLPSFAMVDEAHSLIMEVATPYVEEGFTIRADYWNGELETGKQKLIRHQLFRGNEYWFWLATSEPDCSLKIEVYDAEGQAVTVERTDIPNCAGARVTPAKTGSYYILVKIDWQKTSKPAGDVAWAVAYGYR